MPCMIGVIRRRTAKSAKPAQVRFFAVEILSIWGHSGRESYSVDDLKHLGNELASPFFARQQPWSGKQFQLFVIWPYGVLPE